MKHHWLTGVALFVTACQFRCDGDTVRLGGKPVTVPVAVPQAVAAKNLMLRINGVRVAPQQGAILRVFVELPGANRSTSVDDEHFLGHVTLLARAGPKTEAGSNMVLNVPPHAEKWLKTRRTARVTFVPMSEGEVSIANVQLAPSE